MKFILPALLCVVIAAGAPALLFGMHDPLWLFGLTILVLLIHAGDIKTTADIGITPGVEEVWNEKLYGRKPKLGRVIAVKLPPMILTVVISMAVAGINPIASLVLLAISGGITLKAVVGNIRLLY